MVPITFSPISTLKRLFSRKATKLVPKEIPQAENKVMPLQTEFKSTKELFQYAKSRCLEGIHNSQPYEHAVIVDTKKNRVIAEYKGDANSCRMNDLPYLDLDEKNTTIFHGHPVSYPLSTADLNTLIESKVSCNIAINPDGEFSLAYKRNDFQPKKSKKAFKEFSMNTAEEAYTLKNRHDEYKLLLDYNLRTDSHKMGLRYVTNYNVFVANKKYSS